MATFEAGSVVARFKADMSNFNKGLKEAQQGLKNTGGRIKEAVQQLGSALQEVGVIAGATFAGVTAGLALSIRESNRYSSALMGLRTIAERNGESFENVQGVLEKLTEDGLLPVSDAASALKNLLATGFSLDEATDLMIGFKDSAAFGRQGALQFGEAIVGATEGIKNQNSILVDNAGITKNLSVILREQGKSVNDLQNVTSDASVRQALYNGLMEEMALFTGDATKLSEDFQGQQAALGKETRELSKEVGDTLKPALAELIKEIIPIIRGLKNWVAENPRVASTLAFLVTTVSGLIAGLAATITVLSPVIKFLGALKGLIVAVTAPMWGLVAVVGAVTVGFFAFLFNMEKIADVSQKAGANLRYHFDSAINHVNNLLSRFNPAHWLRVARDRLFGVSQGIQNALADGFWHGVGFINNLLRKFNPMYWLNQKLNDIRNWANNVKSTISGAVDSLNNAGGGGEGQGMFGFLSRFLPGHADGVRNFSGGWSIVGERGPELVNLPRGADVFSNEESRGMMGGLTIQNVNITDRQTADYFISALDNRQRLRKLGVR